MVFTQFHLKKAREHIVTMETIPVKQEEACQVELTKDNQAGTTREAEFLKYTINDSPPWYACALLGLQHFITMFFAQVAMATIISIVICMELDLLVRARLISSMVFVCGVNTILQILLGSRLPIVQGSSPAFFAPVFATMSLPQWKCVTAPNDINVSLANVTSLHLNLSGANLTYSGNITRSIAVSDSSRMRELQGALIVAGLFEIFLGASGMVGLLIRVIGPLVISVVIIFVAVPLVPLAIGLCSKCWPVAGFAFCVMVVSSQLLKKINIPLPGYSKRRKCHMIRYPVFLILPIVLTVFLSWLLCFILTSAGSLGKGDKEFGYAARTDTRSAVIHDSPWFRVPYPFQWGVPTFSLAAAIGMMSAVVASMMESFGDYYTCARLTQTPYPPAHAVNRGIAMEGFGVLLNGLVGTGLGATSYSENIAVIAITRVASRKIFTYAAFWMIILGILGKFGAIFSTVPEPVIGGVFIVTIGFLISAGMSNLQFVNLNSSRNMFVLGVSLSVGLGIPQWIRSQAGGLQTGSAVADQVLTVVLQSEMLVGGILALFFDNVLPGTRADRGLDQWKGQQTLATDDSPTVASNIYELPYSHKWKQLTCLSYLPVCPAFYKRTRLPCMQDNK